MSHAYLTVQTPLWAGYQVRTACHWLYLLLPAAEASQLPPEGKRFRIWASGELRRAGLEVSPDDVLTVFPN